MNLNILKFPEQDLTIFGKCLPTCPSVRERNFIARMNTRNFKKLYTLLTPDKGWCLYHFDRNHFSGCVVSQLFPAFLELAWFLMNGNAKEFL